MLYKDGFTIQTCHGIFPELEQPTIYADKIVAVSEEVQQHLKQKSFKSNLIHNGIDCIKFAPMKPINSSPKTVLSLCQGEQANKVVEEAARALGLEFLHASKTMNNVFEIETLINQADIVVGIGRSLYDAMACGRAVISFDSRSYYMQPQEGGIGLGDGYLTNENIAESLRFNCSGRGKGISFTVESFIEELKKYKAEDGEYMRNFALENLNIKKVVDKYLEIYKESKSQIRFKKLFLIKRRICKLFK